MRENSLNSVIYRSEADLAINIKKATSIDETAPKRKHVRSCIVYTWDHKSSQSFWAGMKVSVLSHRLLTSVDLFMACEGMIGFVCDFVLIRAQLGNQFLPTRFKLSKHWSQYTRFCKKDIQSLCEKELRIETGSTAWTAGLAAKAFEDMARWLRNMSFS